MKILPFACRGLHCRPANGAGQILGVTGHGKDGRSKAPPLRRNCEIALKFKRTLLRFMVGVGLCSTRGALRYHRALGGEQCSPPTMKLQTSDIIIMKILPFACRGLHRRPANGAGADFWVCAAARAGGAKPRPYDEILKEEYYFSPARPFANLRQEKMILHKCSLVLCTKMGYNKIKLLP